MDLADHADQGQTGKRFTKQGPRFRILHRGKSYSADLADLNDFYPKCVNKFNNEYAIKFDYFQCRSSQHSFSFPTF